MNNHPVKTLLDSDLTRRDLLRNAVAGVLLTMPWLGAVDAVAAVPPAVSFTKNKTGDGLVGPFGEVRVTNSNGLVLPAFVVAAGGLAAMNLAVRSPNVQIGVDSTTIVLSSAGVQFGKAAPAKPWTPDTVRALIATIVRDPKKARGIMLLRSALHTTLPVAAMQFKGRMESRFAKTFAAGTQRLGSTSMLSCRTTTVTDLVTRTVVDVVNVWKTAEQQYQECYDREVRGRVCGSWGLAAGICAASTCLAKGFVDVVVGVIEVVSTITEEVTRTVVVCTRAAIGTWPNPWDFPVPAGKITVDQPKQAFTDKDIAGAIEMLKTLSNFFGPYGRCLLEGKWSLAQLATPLDFGSGNVVLPYGIKVCVSSNCATQMAASNVGAELYAAWGTGLSLLAAMSPEFMAAVAGFITPAAGVATFIAQAPPLVVACAALILCFILVALYYGTMLAVQLEYHRTSTDNFADGIVCIEHPTFALALIEPLLLAMGGPPALLIPPIVTG